MLDFSQLIREIPELQYGREAVLFGSTVMFLHGLRKEVGDIDIFVSRKLWGKLLARGWEWRTPKAGDPPFLAKRVNGIDAEINVFFEWDARHQQPYHGFSMIMGAFLFSENVQGLYCQPLDQLYEWKKWLCERNVHPKHCKDALLMEERRG